MVRRFVVLASMALASASCGDGGESDTAALQQIAAADTALNAAISKRDATAIAAFYAAEAVMMPTAEPMIEGRNAIAKEWDQILAIPGFANSTQRLGVEASGDLGYTWGSYRTNMTMEDGIAGVEPGKWLTVWRRQPDGSWLIAMDTYNTDVPPPDHK